MNIAGRQIGAGRPVYVIAELGVNHDGSAERAMELVDQAARAGADAIKLQLFDADRLMSRAAKLAAYQAAAGESDPIAMLRRLQLSPEQMRPVVERARKVGVHAIVTVFSLELVELAEGLGFDAYKTASPDIIHRPLLEALAATGRPLIVSTGAATYDEAARAVGWLRRHRERVAVLQCVSCYPTPDDEAELEGIAALASLSGTVGYSDHTAGVETGARAVRAGATILEKHFTLNRSAPGPDHAASLEPQDFRRYVALARAARREPPTAPTPVATKRVLPIEQDVRAVSRQSIVAARDLPAGHTLARSDVTFKRPGTGLPPDRLGGTLGRRLARPVESDMPLLAEDLGA